MWTVVVQTVNDVLKISLASSTLNAPQAFADWTFARVTCPWESPTAWYTLFFIVAPTCSDGIKNQDETDVDCGGTKCPRCHQGQDCTSDIHCATGYCKSKVCTGNLSLDIHEYCIQSRVLLVQTCDDGIKNQDETDVDCGGLHCPRCNEKQSCLNDSHCTTMYCKSNVCTGEVNSYIDERDMDTLLL